MCCCVGLLCVCVVALLDRCMVLFVVVWFAFLCFFFCEVVVLV